MSNGFEIWLFVMALGASVLGGMLGMASGIFIVPLLTTLAGVWFAIAATIVLVIIAVGFAAGSSSKT